MKGLCKLLKRRRTMVWKSACSLPVLLSVFLSVTASASPLNKEIIFAYPPQGYPPYIITADGDGAPTGIVADAFSQISRETGYKVVFRQYPDRRAQILLQRGKIDAIAFAREWVQSPDNYRWTKPLLKVADHLIFDAHRVIKHADIQSLRGKMIGTMVAFIYPSFENAFNTQSITRTDAPAFKNLFLMLKSGRVDAVLLDERVAGWYIAQSPDLRPDDFAIRRPGFDAVGYRIMMPKLTPLGWGGFIEKYDEKLDQWNSNGRLQALISRYAVKLKQATRDSDDDS